MSELWFNPHDVMLLFTAALSLLLAVPMLLRRNGRQADRALAVFVLTQGLAALYYLLVYSPAFGPTMLRWLGSFEILPLVALYLLQGPLLLRYSGAISGQRVSSNRLEWCLLSIVFALALLGATLAAMRGVRPVFPEIPLSSTALALLVSIVYGMRAIAILRRHDLELRQRFSTIDGLNLRWLSYAAVGFTGVWLLRFGSFFAYAIGGQPLADALGVAVNVPTVLLIAWMITLGLGQAQFRSRKPGQETGETQSAARKSNPELVRKLEHLMTKVKVYQDAELDVEGLADSMGISPRSLSALINGHFGRNFYDFVNHYRVVEAQRRLRDYGERDRTIQRIFEDAGFNSKSTFNTFFKRATGKTPTEYRRAARSPRGRLGGVGHASRAESTGPTESERSPTLASDRRERPVAGVLAKD